MKITKLKIENFKAIKNIKLDNLSNTVLCGSEWMWKIIEKIQDA